jgi:ubiquinone/menaquinone biosynthesis C-methylase UbiE
MQTQDSHFLNPSHIISQIDIKAGSQIGDLGCGAGYMSFASSGAVGEKGKIYAVDIQKGVLEQVKKEAQVENIKNIEILWADLEVPGASKIPNQSLDAVYLVNVLFFLNNKEVAFSEAKRMLKSDGQLLVVEWLSGDMSIGPPADKRVPKETITQLASSTNFSQIKDIDAGKYHYGVLYKNT